MSLILSSLMVSCFAPAGPPAPRMSYLDNGVVRLGVDLNAGGAITYLSPSGKHQNGGKEEQVQIRTISLHASKN